MVHNTHFRPITDQDVRPPATTKPPNTESDRCSVWIRRPGPQLLILAVIGSVAAVAWWDLLRDEGRLGGEQVQLAQAQRQPRRSPFQVFDLDNATVPRNEIRSGGPPVDGIPAISNPRFVAAGQAGFLRPGDRVIGVVVEDEARAYPLKILDYHEAVNDRIGEVPVAVTYCPLCDSAAVFDRRTDDGETEFGISGLLFNSNVLVYDRRSESLWSQVKSESIAGPQVGEALEALPIELTTWQDWRARHRETLVLSTNTGHRRDYNRSPYAGYFSSPDLMFPVEPLDHRLPAKTRVLGVWGPESQRAYPLSAFDSAQQTLELEQELDGRRFTLVFEPESDSLRVERADDGLEWMYSFWFAWAALRSETELFEGAVE